MGRITIKDLQKEIEELKKSIERRDNIIQQLNNEISEMIDNADNSFENSSTYKQMDNKIETLELKVKAITGTAEHNRKLYDNEVKTNEELNEEIQKLKNEDYTLEDIKELEQKIQCTKNNSDRWHREYFNKDSQYKELNEQYSKLEVEIKKIKTENSNLKLNSEVLKEVLKKVKELEQENKQLKDNYKAPVNKKNHNERGAGRKSRFTDKQINEIKQYRDDGKTIKEIAELYKCSVGLIHKLINENNDKVGK